MNEFKLEINLTEKPKYYQIHACIRCVVGEYSPRSGYERSECESIIDKLKEEYEGDKNIQDYLCLIMIKLKIKKGSDRQIVMTDFYNNVTKLGRGLSPLSKKLKGGARAILCMILNKSLNAGILKQDDIIRLEASGDLEDEHGNQKEMIGLINYYKMLGFKIEDESDLEEQIDNMSVYMYGIVGTLLNKCSDIKNISPELLDIIKQI
jgi:hypothetical protein